MFVSSKRLFVSLENLLLGHEYEIDSGSGGGYIVCYEGKNQTHCKFTKIYRRGAEKGPKIEYDIPIESIGEVIYITVPENPIFYRWERERREYDGILPFHEAHCKQCREFINQKIELIGPDGSVVIVVFNKDSRIPKSIYFSSKAHELCFKIEKQIGKTIEWDMKGDNWLCNHDVPTVYNALSNLGYEAHGEEFDWLKTGKWPE